MFYFSKRLCFWILVILEMWLLLFSGSLDSPRLAFLPNLMGEPRADDIFELPWLFGSPLGGYCLTSTMDKLDRL